MTGNTMYFFVRLAQILLRERSSQQTVLRPCNIVRSIFYYKRGCVHRSRFPNIQEGSGLLIRNIIIFNRNVIHVLLYLL